MDFEEDSNIDDYLPVCADCGASRPEWASINRGVLICSECCHVHRNLGRHISQIKSLKKGIWHSNQLSLMTVLYRSGSNNIWEHSLIDVSSQNIIRSKKKPVSNDPIIPKKEAFIKAKYVQMAYAIRPSKDDSITIDDLNKQLWSCVRTAHVETTLRLLALGADPNYADPESGNTPLHVAGKEGQKLQVELLWIYGADPGQKNARGKTPTELANEENYLELAQRLIELEFEVTDRFSMFLCGRKADHSKQQQQHFLIPDLAGQISETIKKFRKLLQNSSGIQLERLIQDVYDEVDRREINLQWIAAEQFRIGNQHIAFFLPPNNKLSATRNQLRQKLAKFDARDFSQLIIDLLKEIRRRYFCHPLPPTAPEDDRIGEIAMVLNQQNSSCISNLDDSRDYDEVACSDAGRNNNNNSNNNNNQPKSRGGSTNTRISSANKIMDFDGEEATSTTDPLLLMNPAIALDNYLELKEKLSETTDKFNSVINTNLQMLKEFQSLKKSVEQIQNEQSTLWDQIKLITGNINDYSIAPQNLMLARKLTSPPNLSTATDIGAVIMPTSSLLNKSSQQIIDNNSYRSISNPNTMNRLNSTTMRQNSLTQQKSLLFDNFQQQQQQQQSNGSKNSHLFYNNSSLEYSSAQINSNEIFRNDSLLAPSNDEEALTESLPMNSSTGLKALFNDEVFPDNLIIETELLTGAIKNLLSDLQQSGPNDANSTFHADSISHHISRIVRVIPHTHMIGVVHLCVSEMESAMTELSKKCLQRPLNPDETCHAAYDLAKAAKQLLVTVHNRNDFV